MAERALKFVTDNDTGEVISQSELCANCEALENDRRDILDRLASEKRKNTRLQQQLVAKRKRDIQHGRIMDVLEYWRQECMPRAIIAVDSKRWEIVLDRFNDELVGRESWTVEELKLAVDGAKLNPWLNGTAKDATKQYLDVQHVFKDAERVEASVNAAIKYEELVGVLPSEIHRKLIGIDMQYELEDCSCGCPRFRHGVDRSTGKQPCRTCSHCEDMDPIHGEVDAWIKEQIS